MDWQIHYSDGTVFSSDDGSWEEAPGRDVQVVLFRDRARGWLMRHGANMKHADFFRQDADGTIVGMDLPGMLDHVTYECGCVKQGRMLSQDAWERVYNDAATMLAELQQAG